MVKSLAWELVALAGLALIGLGLWWTWPPLACLFGGGVLFKIGLAGCKHVP